MASVDIVARGMSDANTKSLDNITKEVPSNVLASTVAIPFELGTIDGSGINSASSTIARSVGFLTFNYNQICNLLADPSIYFKIYAYNLDGSFISVMTGNVSAVYNFLYYGANRKYRLTIWYTNNRTITTATIPDLALLFTAQVTTLDTVIKNNVSILNKSYTNGLTFGVASKLYSDLSYTSYGFYTSDYINTINKVLYLRCTNPLYLLRVVKYDSAGVLSTSYPTQSSYSITNDGFLYKVYIYRANAGEVISNYQDALNSLQIFAGITPLAFTDNTAQNLDLSKYKVKFNNPYNTLKAVVGHEFNIYFDDFISTNKPKDVRYEAVCSTLTTAILGFSECIRITPITGNIGTHTITVNVYTVDYILIASTTITLTIIADITLSTAKKLLCIGDSLTQDGTIVTTLKSMFGSNLTLYGTRGTSPNFHEGRASWGAYQYTTLATYNSIANTFWNPGTSLFDFAYYITQNPTFADVTHVNIYLGQNDGYSSAGITAIATIVNSIKAYDSNIVITICTLHILPDNNDGCGLTQQNVYQFRLLARAFNQMLVNTFGSMTNVYIVPTHINVDTVYDYPYSTLQVSARNTATVMRYTNNVHFNTFGYYKVADVLYNWYVSLFS